MKTEINNENKAKFFALYWGQMVLSDGIEIGGNVGDCEEEMFLLLKPLSSISDEDAIECRFDDSKEFLEEIELCGLTYQSHNIDYLRSKGYAIPWMGLSVKEMIEAGWIILI